MAGGRYDQRVERTGSRSSTSNGIVTARSGGRRAAPDAGEGTADRAGVDHRGVHPYDEVDWERRDVVMTNWRDGSINFEQRGVEYPDVWSVNAANIVTRSTSGVRSARRSASGRAAAALRPGRAEPTARRARSTATSPTRPTPEIFDPRADPGLLLHQVFSFNSPVWFNVGTHRRSRSAPAFILSVDDSMDSILDWYKEEG
jgi:ribonucleoside-diphosphate reductase alpha chain